MGFELHFSTKNLPFSNRFSKKTHLKCQVFRLKWGVQTSSGSAKAVCNTGRSNNIGIICLFKVEYKTAGMACSIVSFPKSESSFWKFPIRPCIKSTPISILAHFDDQFLRMFSLVSNLWRHNQAIIIWCSNVNVSCVWVREASRELACPTRYTRSRNACD